LLNSTARLTCCKVPQAPYSRPMQLLHVQYVARAAQSILATETCGAVHGPSLPVKEDGRRPLAEIDLPAPHHPASQPPARRPQTPPPPPSDGCGAYVPVRPGTGARARLPRRGGQAAPNAGPASCPVKLPRSDDGCGSFLWGTVVGETNGVRRGVSWVTMSGVPCSSSSAFTLSGRRPDRDRVSTRRRA
jgi:hypothetical protein